MCCVATLSCIMLESDRDHCSELCILCFTTLCSLVYWRPGAKVGWLNFTRAFTAEFWLVFLANTVCLAGCIQIVLAAQSGRREAKGQGVGGWTMALKFVLACTLNR